ncbi:hypothetical protein DM01DRAFT_89404 [Hesseltinella vesiculosa]|uniref:Zn(2)-C6 fungal-type domain-containing protein n=1 Tax=Hesseltinella vesiculosa TaxID=101127 RepID=A0A1X2G4F1_9FUNG|nr:hypothetical protein DM01DRAFT_89404 [Hesseltinella vesiculosa]
MNDPKHQKRNLPCEHCRTNRRKCLVDEGQTICKRCLGKQVPCLFKFSIRPVIVKKVVPTNKKQRLVHRVAQLTQDIELLEEELTSMTLWQKGNDDDDDDDWDSECPEAVQHQERASFLPASAADWQISLKQTSHGLQLDTNVTNMHDLLQLLHARLGGAGLPYLPNTFPPDEHDCIPVATCTTPFEFAVRRVYSSALDRSHTRRRGSTWLALQWIETSAMDQGLLNDTKRRLIDIYFDCFNQWHALLVPPLMQPFLQRHPDHMLAWAVCGFVTTSWCKHLAFFQDLPWERHDFADFCTKQAHERIMDNPFNDEDQHDPTSLTFEDVARLAAIHLVAGSGLFSQHTKLAQTMSVMAWRHAVFLKDLAVPILKRYRCNRGELLHLYQSSLSSYHHFDTPQHHPHRHDAYQQTLPIADCIDTSGVCKCPRFCGSAACSSASLQQLMVAETWRRLYYSVRQMEVSMPILNPGHVVSNIHEMGLHKADIGQPQLMPMEWSYQPWRHSGLSFHYLIKFENMIASAFGGEIVRVSVELLSGLRKQLSVSHLAKLEKRYIDYWHDLPPAFRLSDTPFEYLQMDRIQQFPLIRMLRIHIAIYVSWLATMVRFVKAGRMDMTGVSFDRMDPERAALIVSISCDAIIKIYYVLHCRLPCTLEFHWMVFSLEGVLMLFNAKDPDIRARARRNAVLACDIFRQQYLRSVGVDDLLPNQFPAQKQQKPHHHPEQTKPSQQHVPPQQQHVPPQQQHAPPQQQYAPPQHNTSLPSSNMPLPSSNMSLPSSNMSIPSSKMSLPSSNMSLPSSNMSLPSSNTSLPSSNMSLPSSNMSLPSSNMSLPSSSLILLNSSLTLCSLTFLKGYLTFLKSFLIFHSRH